MKTAKVYNEVLARAIRIMKLGGFKVYTFKHSVVRQVFFVKDGVSIGTCSVSHLSSVSIGTVHMPCRESGTGFCIEADCQHVSIGDLERCFSSGPSWASLKGVKKWGSWEHRANACTLDYFEI